MTRVTGIGGVFFKSADPAGLARWYREHLGVPCGDDGHAMFRWREADAGGDGMTVWALCSSATATTSAPLSRT